MKSLVAFAAFWRYNVTTICPWSFPHISYCHFEFCNINLLVLQPYWTSHGILNIKLVVITKVRCWIMKTDEYLKHLDCIIQSSPKSSTIGISSAIISLAALCMKKLLKIELFIICMTFFLLSDEVGLLIWFVLLFWCHFIWDLKNFLKF